jgi:hypothetical protein
MKLHGKTAFAAIGLFVVASMAFAIRPGLATGADADASPFIVGTAATPSASDTRVVAVLFSVSRTDEARKQFREVPDIDLLDVNGEPMIMHVYNALRQSRYVQKIIVVAAPETAAALDLKDDPGTSFIIDKGDAAKNVEFGVDEIGKGDLIMFVPSDLVLVTAEGLDRLVERVIEEKDVDIFIPIVSREVCENAYPDERRTYARFQDGQYTGAHVEFLRPDLFLDHADRVKSEKDSLYDVYHMRRNALGMARFLGLKLTVKYLFGALSAQDVEQHIYEKYNVTAKALRWDDPDLTTDLSEPRDIQMIQRVMEQRETAHSKAHPAGDNHSSIASGATGV